MVTPSAGYVGASVNVSPEAQIDSADGGAGGDTNGVETFIDGFNDLKKYITSQTQLKGKQLSIPLRFALTGSTSGPNLSEVYPLIKNYLGEIIK